MRLCAVNIKDRREHFVADKDIILVTKHGVRAGEPAVAVKLVMIKAKLADELRVFRTAAFHPVADVENDQSVAPVGEIGQAVFDLQIVQIAPADLFAFLGA